jgi:hypothetical protein
MLGQTARWKGVTDWLEMEGRESERGITGNTGLQ